MNKMEGRRMWEDLNVDCLLNVLGRVGVESLLLDVPFVRKSWYKATLNPSSWECLHFPHLGCRYCSKGNDESFQKRFTLVYGTDSRISDTALMKFVVKSSRGRATSLKLPSCSRGLFKYSAKMFPELKVLSLPMSMKVYKSKVIADLIGKRKHLESLTFLGCYGMETILMEISRHCKKLRSLQLVDAYVCADKALAIAVFLPEIKQLSSYLPINHFPSTYSSSMNYNRLKPISNHPSSLSSSLTIVKYFLNSSVFSFGHLCWLGLILVLDLSFLIIFQT